MKKLTTKAKRIMVATGSAVVCVGVLCAVLFQQSANAAAANAVTHKNTSSVTSTTSFVSVPPIHKDTASSTAKVESAWTPSSGENKTTSLAPAAPKNISPRIETIEYTGKMGWLWVVPFTKEKQSTEYHLYIPVNHLDRFQIN